MFLVVGPIPVIVTRLEDGRLQVSLPTHIPVRVALTHSADPEPQAVAAAGYDQASRLANLYRMAANPQFN